MRILIACESSGAVRDAFARLGHQATSCDLLPTDLTRMHPNASHYCGDVRDILGRQWDMLIAHPPCTYLCSSGLHWNKRTPGRTEKTMQALEFARLLMDQQHISRICIENPVGCIGTRIKPATQYIQPYEFGDDASKRTGLWLKGLPKLSPTGRYPGRIVSLPSGKQVERWANQCDSGQNKLGPSADRWQKRSETYTGIADAMATQWGTPCCECGSVDDLCYPEPERNWCRSCYESIY